MPRERRDLHPVRRIDPEMPDMQEAPRQRNLADAVPGKQEYAEAPRIKASCPFMSIRVHSWFSLSPLLFLWISCVSCVSWFRTCPPRHHLYSCPFVPIRGSEFFVSFVSFVVQSIRALSCPFVPIRGSLLLNGRAAEPPRGRAQARHPRTTFSFLLPTPYFRVHSCPFVVLSFFRVFRVFRGLIHSCLSWFNPFVPFRAHSWF